MIITAGRETVSAEQIRHLNQLSWDKKSYSNWHFADGTVGLEINYYLGNAEYRYKVICADYRQVELLRCELDSNCYLNAHGHIVSKK